MVNKLVKLFTKMVHKIADHAKAIKFNKDTIEDVSQEVGTLQEKEKEKCEDIMKLKAECLKLKEMLNKAEEHSAKSSRGALKAT